MLRIKAKFRRAAFAVLVFATFFFCAFYCPANNRKHFVGHNRRLGHSSFSTDWNIQKNENLSEFIFRSEKFKKQRRSTFGAEIIAKTSKQSLNISVEIRPKPILTLFTTWAEERDRYLVHNLTVKNWQSLIPYVIPVVFTNQSSVAKECRRHGWDVFPIRVWANGEIPVLKFMFLDIISFYNTSFYGFSNSDILFTDSLIETLTWLRKLRMISEPVMLVGKRTNVNYVGKEDIVTWKRLNEVASFRGKLFRGLAEDYFITSRYYPWKDIPEVVIGRPAYDNWLVYNARKQRQTVIDATRTILAVHQTTRAGNIEGKGRPNSSYNRDLLERLYKDILFDAGFVDCVNLSTKYDGRSVILVKRTVPKNCFIH